MLLFRPSESERQRDRGESNTLTLHICVYVWTNSNVISVFIGTVEQKGTHTHTGSPFDACVFACLHHQIHQINTHLKTSIRPHERAAHTHTHAHPTQTNANIHTHTHTTTTHVSHTHTGRQPMVGQGTKPDVALAGPKNHTTHTL